MKFEIVIRTFLALFATLVLPGTAIGDGYRITDLGIGTGSDINDSAHAVGLTPAGQVIFFDGALVSHPVLYDYISPTNSVWNISDPLAEIRINNSDLLAAPVGNAGRIWTNIQTGVPTTVDIDGPLEFSINDVGGWASSYNSFAPFKPGPDDCRISSGQRAIGEMRAINNHDLAAGYYQSQTIAGPFTTVYGRHIAAILGPIGLRRIDLRDTSDVDDYHVVQHTSEAFGINNLGHVCGQMTVDDNQRTNHAFFYRGNGLEDLGAYGGVGSTALDINDSDVVVGTYTTSDGSSRAIMWKGGIAQDLNDVLPANSGWVLLRANAINSHGDIVGDGMYQGGVHAYVLSAPIGGTRPSITQDPIGALLTVGDAYQLKVVATGAGVLNYQWQKNQTNLPGQVSSFLNITNATVASVGNYRVLVGNAAGTIPSKEVRIDVIDAKLSIAPSTGTGFPLAIHGEQGGHYRLEYSAYPDGTGGWSLAANLTLTDAIQVFLVSPPADSNELYYRCVRSP